MSLVLTLVQSPRPQPVRQMRLEDGALVIGRSPEADWHIDDPDMFVSRTHCTVAGGGGRFSVTDTSSGGLFVDDGARPLGAGNSAELRHGMRLRLGDYVVRVEMQDAARPREPAAPEPAAAPEPRAAWGAPEFDADAFFATPAAPAPKRQRPSDLPDPFERPRAAREPAPERRGPPAFDDPFTLDPVPSGNGKAADASGFSWDEPAPARADTPKPPPSGAFWDEPAVETTPTPVRPAAAPVPRTAPPRGGAPDEALAAFVRGLGLGLDPADAPGGDPQARLEALGREYRLMAEGLMHLLRMRAEEKSNARIVRTTVGAAEVNPLKFMPNVEDALAVMLAARSAGFTDAEGAIIGAVRDLASHHASAWRGMQAALRRMVDRFDPKALEAELAALGLLGTLLAGGRRAKLWELYEKRYREIAQSAETRFLGEVGADFRDAYEKDT